MLYHLLLYLKDFSSLQVPCNFLSEEKLIELTSKAYTPGAAGLIYDYCAHEDAFLEMLYSKSCKCAIKAGKAKNLAAVSLIVDQCGL